MEGKYRNTHNTDLSLNCNYYYYYYYLFAPFGGKIFISMRLFI